jgi:hypothetical protein
MKDVWCFNRFIYTTDETRRLNACVAENGNVCYFKSCSQQWRHVSLHVTNKHTVNPTGLRSITSGVLLGFGTGRKWFGNFMLRPLFFRRKITRLPDDKKLSVFSELVSKMYRRKEFLVQGQNRIPVPRLSKHNLVCIATELFLMAHWQCQRQK